MRTYTFTLSNPTRTVTIEAESFAKAMHQLAQLK
jgi:hypothetical protein